MRHGRTSIAMVLLLAWGAAARPAGAAEAARGRLLAAGCATCHGAAAGEAGALPALQGSAATTVVSALRDFRDGRRAGTVMPQLARGLADADIDAVAAYLAAGRRP